VSPATVRMRPCPSCPYRRDVPSGIWAASEYEKLPAYDQPTWAQPPALFMCHSASERICAGWAGCHDMGESLAARLAVGRGEAGPEIFDYTTPVPLFASGAEAAEHGMRDLPAPGPAARRKAASLARMRVGRTGAGR
jgi:hypothetical protein